LLPTVIIPQCRRCTVTQRAPVRAVVTIDRAYRDIGRPRIAAAPSA